jgi:hypothetical protein
MNKSRVISFLVVLCFGVGVAAFVQNETVKEQMVQEPFKDVLWVSGRQTGDQDGTGPDQDRDRGKVRDPNNPDAGCPWADLFAKQGRKKDGDQDGSGPDQDRDRGKVRDPNNPDAGCPWADLFAKQEQKKDGDQDGEPDQDHDRNPDCERDPDGKGPRWLREA